MFARSAMIPLHGLTALLFSLLILVAAAGVAQNRPPSLGSCATLPDVERTAEILFDAKGHLIASPPSCLFQQDTLTFSVGADPEIQETMTAAAAERLISTIHGIRQLQREEKDSMGVTTHRLWGLGPQDFDDVVAGLCLRARALAVNLNANRQIVDRELDSLSCAPPSSGCTVFVPKILQAERTIDLRCFDFNGAQRGAQKGKPLPLKLSPQQVGAANTQAADCAKLDYELRLSDPVIGMAKDWATKHQMPQNLRKLIEDAPAKIKEPQAVVARYREFAACLAAKVQFIQSGPQGEARLKAIGESGLLDPQACGSSVEEALRDVNSATTVIDGTRNEITKNLGEGNMNWVKNWLWFTGGIPRLNPFASEPELLAAEIKKIEGALVTLEAQVATFELIATNHGLAISDLSKLPEGLKPFIEIRAQRDTLKKSLEKARARLSDVKETSDTDELLYQGELYTSTRGRQVFADMQHHDAQNEYLVMAPMPVREIRESERLYILAENEAVDTKLKAAVTVTKISPDVSLASAEIALPASNEPPQTASAEEKRLHIVSSFIQAYATLADMVAFLEEQLSLPPLVFDPPKDLTPALVTRLVPHEVPSLAPATVAYTIQKKVGDKAEDAWKGEYRVNKLYHLRVKAGIVYSTLKTSDFTVGTADKVTESIDRHGADGTFGVQIFFRPRDIRNSTPAERAVPALYIGFLMKNLPNNLVVGPAWEIWPGVSFLGGAHVGKGEKLIKGDAPRIESKWDVDYFAGMIIDTDFFRQLFGLKGLL